MDKLIKAANRFGGVGTFIANILVFISTNWWVVMAAFVAVFTAIWETSLQFAQRQEVQTFVWVFLALLWTHIGLAVLRDRRRPTVITPHQDYAHGLTFEGISWLYQPHIEQVALVFALQFRNNSSGPIKYDIEVFDIKIGNRTLPDFPQGSFTSVMPRGGGRIARHSAFSRDDIKDFMGKEVAGTLKFGAVYGHPEKAPERRLKMSFSLHLSIQGDGALAGCADLITSESDEVIAQ